KSSPDELVRSLRTQGFVEITSESGKWLVHPEDVIITEQPRSGWTVVSHDGESVALDLTLNDELIAKGQVREVIRYLQEARKNEGFDISDRIHVRYNARAEVILAIVDSSAHIQGEVLALSLLHDPELSLGSNDLGLAALLKKNT
ncbi:MAG: isoleucine--tRNA ligase, partial [Actinobacteria bacterium]|nr:isoleucine--tRNA ligase [Actinomycetota bacterium]